METDSLNPLEGMIQELRKLPGVGPKSAQRMAFHLLSLPSNQVETFSRVILSTRQNIRYCETCFNISFHRQCSLCQDETRDNRLCCVVAEPRDIFAIEKTHAFRGRYHVLGGLISPIDGVHPEGLRIKELLTRLEPVTELILAINPTIEGDATVLYLSSLLKEKNINMTKLAHGLPMGGDIDYADDLTLQKAFQGRHGV